MEEVVGSIPTRSTKYLSSLSDHSQSALALQYDHLIRLGCAVFGSQHPDEQQWDYDGSMYAIHLEC